MKKFTLYATITIGIYTEVEAETLEEAIEISKEREIEQAAWGDTEQKQRCWVSDEYDGTPENICEDE